MKWYRYKLILLCSPGVYVGLLFIVLSGGKLWPFQEKPGPHFDQTKMGKKSKTR